MVISKEDKKQPVIKLRRRIMEYSRYYNGVYTSVIFSVDPQGEESFWGKKDDTEEQWRKFEPSIQERIMITKLMTGYI